MGFKIWCQVGVWGTQFSKLPYSRDFSNIWFQKLSFFFAYIVVFWKFIIFFENFKFSNLLQVGNFSIFVHFLRGWGAYNLSFGGGFWDEWNKQLQCCAGSSSKLPYISNFFNIWFQNLTDISCKRSLGLGNVYWTFNVRAVFCLFETLKMFYCAGSSKLPYIRVFLKNRTKSIDFR